MNMIDIHCHIIYGVDDGAQTPEESKALLKVAAENNIKAIIATPHLTNLLDIGTFLSRRNKRVRALNGFCAEMGLNIGVGAGAEVYLSDDVFAADELNKVTLNRSRYLLCEYTLEPFDPEYAFVYAERIASLGLVPIIAHPERYSTFHRSPWVVDELLSMGALFQVNASSLAGRERDSVRDFATEMVLSGNVSFIATDAHSAEYRPNDIMRCCELFDGRISRSVIKRLIYDNPLRAIRNDDIPLN